MFQIAWLRYLLTCEEKCFTDSSWNIWFLSHMEYRDELLWYGPTGRSTEAKETGAAPAPWHQAPLWGWGLAQARPGCKPLGWVGQAWPGCGELGTSPTLASLGQWLTTLELTWDPGPAIEKTKKRKYNHISQSNPVSCPPLQSALCHGPGRGTSLNRHYDVTIHSILHVKIFNPTGSNCVTTAVYV